MKVVAVCLAFVFAVEIVFGLFDSCIHGGRKYEEGEFFLPNDSIIKPEGPQQCVQCRCQQGLVLCEIENCPTLDCESPLKIPQFCCLRCPGTVQEKEVTSDFVFEKPQTHLNGRKNLKGDCVSNGKHFKNGSVWQPVIGPFGVMACVQCRCQEGNIICSRLNCGDPLCPRPRREFGQCCPVCPISEESKRKTLCLPKISELFVFRTPNVRNNSGKIEYAFVENKENPEEFKIHTWNLQAKNFVDVLSLSVVPRSEFHKSDFQILGSISKKEEFAWIET